MLKRKIYSLSLLIGLSISVGFLGASVKDKPSVTKESKAAENIFTTANWTQTGTSWTLNGSTAVNTNKNWTPGNVGTGAAGANFLLYTPSSHYSLTKKDSLNNDILDYTVQATFSSTHSITSGSYGDGDEQFRGIVLFYYDMANYLLFNAKWQRNQTTTRVDTDEIAQFTLYGYINGSFAYTTWTTEWTNPEWRDDWADNPTNYASLDEEVTLKVHLYNRSGEATDDTNTIDVTTSSPGHQNVLKSNILGHKDILDYITGDARTALLNGTAKVGLYSRSTIDENVTFSGFEIVNEPPLIEISPYSPIGAPITSGDVGEKVRIPEYIGYSQNTTGLELDVTRVVTDPSSNEVEIKDGGSEGDYFVPTTAGNYTVTVTCTENGLTSTTNYSVYVTGGSGDDSGDSSSETPSGSDSVEPAGSEEQAGSEEPATSEKEGQGEDNCLCGWKVTVTYWPIVLGAVGGGVGGLGIVVAIILIVRHNKKQKAAEAAAAARRQARRKEKMNSEHSSDGDKDHSASTSTPRVKKPQTIDRSKTPKSANPSRRDDFED